jgi:flagellar protein FliO/FliZ
MSPEARYLLESLATVAIFGGALFVAVRGLRRLGGAAPRGPIEIMARQPLEGRRAIYLVKIGGRVLVVGATDERLTRLASFPAAELAAATEPPVGETPARPSFGEVVARKVRDLRRPARPPDGDG